MGGGLFVVVSAVPSISFLTPVAGRFLTMPKVADELATFEAQITALVRRGELPAIELGGRGQGRIERAKLEEFIAQGLRGDRARAAAAWTGMRTNT